MLRGRTVLMAFSLQAVDLIGHLHVRESRSSHVHLQISQSQNGFPTTPYKSRHGVMTRFFQAATLPLVDKARNCRNSRWLGETRFFIFIFFSSDFPFIGYIDLSALVNVVGTSFVSQARVCARHIHTIKSFKNLFGLWPGKREKHVSYPPK